MYREGGVSAYGSRPPVISQTVANATRVCAAICSKLYPGRRERSQELW